VTGHSYVVYGPLALGATTLIFEGVPTYPKPDRFWEIVERYRVTAFYTAPTAIRALMKEGEEWVKRRGISSLRILGSVGEPINPEAWRWYYKYVGQERCPIMDTWWQTETGGFLISPLPITPLKPGSATFPFPGVLPKILREDGSECDAEEGGSLVIAKPWPGMLRGFWNDPERKRFKDTYFYQAYRYRRPRGGARYQLLFPLVRVNFELGVIMVIAVSCVKLLSAHNSTQHTSRKHKV
jgi:acetyl-coenzyme A synthetase (EC 6.2.1.1)